MSVQLAFSINDVNRAWTSRLICIFTRAKAYHCEIVLTDGIGITATAPDGIIIEPKIYDFYSWTMIPIPWINETEEHYLKLRAQSLQKSGEGYDYLGCVLGSLSKYFNVKNKWFCSELCAHLLRPYVDTIQQDRWYSPDLLWKHVVKKLNKEQLCW